MKTSNIYFTGLTIIFLVYGILVAPKDVGLAGFSEYVFGFLVLGLLAGFITSWIYREYTHEDRKLASDSKIGRS